MDLAIARSLSDQTTDFYRCVSASFDATRQAPWPGWARLLELVGASLPRVPRVLDLACGNLRFERYLVERGFDLQVCAVDSCDELVLPGIETLRSASPASTVDYRTLDVADALFSDEDLTRLIDVPPCDMAVAFGFLHHVVLAEQRERVLRTLVDAVVPGGFAVVSLWQFAHDERLRSKATPVVGGNAGDFLMGWQGRQDVCRFCHSFEEDEIDRLAHTVSRDAHELARFSADGRSGALNRYLVLQRAQ